MTLDEDYMRRCFDLARNGLGAVSSNPLVGCVITHNDRIIGEGWHKKYGGPHAEVNAVESVVDKTLLPESTVYVNLEPCSHFGKTPPCADMLVRHNVKKVVVSNVDSNELVAGKGIQKLLGAGIEVVTGVLATEGRELNKRFFTFIEKKRPYIILKWAQSADGFISRKDEATPISNLTTKQLTHKWRTEEDAFMIGTRTAAIDNPKLNVREWIGRNPVRIVVDRNLKLDSSLNIFDGTQPTICYNLVKDEELENLRFVRIDGSDFIRSAVSDMYRRNIQSVVVEGGATLLNLFISLDLWDEARVFVSPSLIHDGVAAPVVGSEPASSQGLGDNRLLTYQNFSVNPRGSK